MPTAQRPSPSLSFSLSLLLLPLSRGGYGLTSMMSASESTPAAGISATSAAGTSVASGDPTSSVSVSTAADMIRMFRTAARDCCARVRHTAAWYLCAGTMRCVGRTLCRKADVDPARPSMIARGRLTRTDLILKSLRRDGGERGFGRPAGSVARGKVRRWAWCSKPGWFSLCVLGFLECFPLCSPALVSLCRSCHFSSPDPLTRTPRFS